MRGERRQPLGDRGQARLGVSRRACSGAGEIEMIALEHARLFERKPELVLVGLKRIDALEQRLAQIDIAAMARENRRDLPLDRLKLVIGRRAREVEEYFRHAIEAAPAPFQRFNRIGEGRRGRICRDGVDLGAMVFKRDVESGPKMRGLDAVERGRLERPGPGLKKWILVNIRLGHQCLRLAFADPAAASLSGRRGLMASDVRIAMFGQRVRPPTHARAVARPQPRRAEGIRRR